MNGRQFQISGGQRQKKYTDLIAVIDPYHELPTGWTYTQVHLWLQYESLMLDNLGLK